MIDLEITKKVSKLPAKQQIALWVILKKFHKPEQTWFTVPELAVEMKKYLTSEDPAEIARIMGGVMSSLKRNGMIEQVTGDRQPIWTVVPEIHLNAEKYRDSVFPVVTYWRD